MEMKAGRPAYVIASILFLGSFGSLNKLVNELSFELRDLQWQSDISSFEEMLETNRSELLQSIDDTEMSMNTSEVFLGELEQDKQNLKHNNSVPLRKVNDAELKISSNVSSDPKVLLAIVSGRGELHTRAKGIVETWAKDTPESFIPMVFVGEATTDDGIQSGSPEDLDRLTKAAGIHNNSKVQIVVMEGIPDDEYPPVYKNTGMVKHLNKIAENLEANGQKVEWAFKVDDDAYVHYRGVIDFLKTRDATKDGYYGQRGLGRPKDRKGIQKSGLTGPFCMGGSGWIVSRSTLRKTALDIDQCVATADKSEYRYFMWHSDTVIGLCVQRSTGKNCWTDDDYSKKHVPFRHNYNTSIGSRFLPDAELPTIAVMHPFKDPKVMARLHARFQKVIPAELAKRKNN